MSTRLPDRPASSSWRDEGGFTLLEVILAMTILAAGLAAVLGLFSGGMKSVDVSEQYLEAAALADSRLQELELVDFHPADMRGTFVENNNYRWELEITPFEAALYNLPEDGVKRLKLTVLWDDLRENRRLELVTLWREGQTVPLSDQELMKIFRGGESDLEGDENNTPSQTAPASAVPSAPKTVKP